MHRWMHKLCRKQRHIGLIRVICTIRSPICTTLHQQHRCPHETGVDMAAECGQKEYEDRWLAEVYHDEGDAGVEDFALLHCSNGDGNDDGAMMVVPHSGVVQRDDGGIALVRKDGSENLKTSSTRIEVGQLSEVAEYGAATYHLSTKEHYGTTQLEATLMDIDRRQLRTSRIHSAASVVEYERSA